MQFTQFMNIVHVTSAADSDASYHSSTVRQRWPTPCRSCRSWRWTWREVEQTRLRLWNQKWSEHVPAKSQSTATLTTSVFRGCWRLWSLRNQRRPRENILSFVGLSRSYFYLLSVQNIFHFNLMSQILLQSLAHHKI